MGQISRDIRVASRSKALWVPAARLDVGRMGVLAGALGIGAVLATGLGAAVANADADGSDATPRGRVKATSQESGAQSVTNGEVSRRGAALSAGRSAPVATVGDAASRRSSAKLPAAASALAPTRSPSSLIPTRDVHIGLPAAPSPERATTVVPTAASAVNLAPSYAISPNSVALQQLSTPETAAGGPVATAVRYVVTALSNVANRTAPELPADGAVALMMAAVRRAESTTPTLTQATPAQATTTGGIEAESMTISPSNGGRVISDSNASGGQGIQLTSNAIASGAVALPDSTALVIRAKATLSSGAPNLTLSVDGVPVTTIVVKGTSWSDYTITGVIPAGSHVISISSSNATSRRSLYIDTISATTGSFVEDFTGSAGSVADPANWTAKVGYGWDIGLETYQTANATLDGQGNLNIKAAKSKTRGGYSSGWVDTKNKVSFGYGTITARIKVPKGQGLWPSFWIKGANEDTVPWPQSGEIDVLELPSTTTTIYSSVHGPIAGTTETLQAQISSTNLPDLSVDYHNYWVRHLPDEITFGVDDITLGTLTPDSLVPGSEWVFNQPMYVILNMAVGGSWAGDPNSSTPFPSSMLVDWVRWDPAV